MVSTGFATLTPRHGVHPRFLFWALRSDVLIEDVVARSVGVSYPAITATELGTLPISVPSIDRQMQVSNYLDDETSRIDELISEQEWQLRLIAEHRHALLSQAVSARVGGGRSTLDGALGALPDGWRLVPLKAVATIQSGLTLGKSYEGPLELRPYIRVANVQDGYIDTDDVAAISLPREVLRRHELRTGDVLINEGNGNPANLGRGAIWDGSIPGCVHQNHVFAIRPGESVRPLWIEFLLASSAGRAYFVATSSQVGIASTNRAKVGRFPVPLPRVEEQDRVLGNVRDRLGRLDAVREEVSAQIALLREHRQALITMAVGTGLDALRGVA